MFVNLYGDKKEEEDVQEEKIEEMKLKLDFKIIKFVRSKTKILIVVGFSQSPKTIVTRNSTRSDKSKNGTYNFTHRNLPQGSVYVYNILCLTMRDVSSP